MIPCGLICVSLRKCIEFGFTNRLIVTTSQHRVRAYVNGTFAGELLFDGQSQGQARFTLAMSQFREGSNVLRFVAQGGAGDVSLADYTRISYWHKFQAAIRHPYGVYCWMRSIEGTRLSATPATAQ